jgi:hypothetical protein
MPENRLVRDYRRLQVWQQAHELTLAIYQASKGFPSWERRGLSAQLRSAAVSIEANIAEGAGVGPEPTTVAFSMLLPDQLTRPNAR